MKISTTPLSTALKDLILALKDSAKAFVERLMKKLEFPHNVHKRWQLWGLGSAKL